MGKVIIAGGGGSGAGSDECTATKAELLKGYTAITGDSDDEVVEGTLELTGDAADSQVLDKKTYYNKDAKIKRTGTMQNVGAVSVSLNAGVSYTIPGGYHNGSGKVTANSLASQTGGTAIPSHVLNGETFWVNGNKSIGTMSVQSILSFSCAPYSASQIIFTWQNPSIGPFSGVIIIGKTGGYPANINDGTRYYKGFGNNTYGGGVSNTVIGGFGINVTYYFRAFSYSMINNEEWLSSTTRTSYTIIQQIKQIFYNSTNWTVPFGVNSIDIFCVGGGGAGGSSGGAKYEESGGGGGGGGYTKTIKGLPVVPNQNIFIIVGGGGVGQINGYGRSGDDTYVTISGTTAILASGGGGGRWGVDLRGNGGGGSGGSGGGQGGYNYGNGGCKSGNGGTNGGDAEVIPNTNNQGMGQHYTTTEFEEHVGTQYSGGGGGGAHTRGVSTIPGNGGYFGGGNGGAVGQNGVSGTPNSGGGGGGGGASNIAGGNGGSGICIIRYIG